MGQNDLPDPLEQVFLHAHPNPTRIGCPSQDVLQAIARKEVSLDHPAFSHIAECSECFRDIKGYQARWTRRRRRRYAFVAAAVLVIFGGGLTFYFGTKRLGVEPHQSTAAAAGKQTTARKSVPVSRGVLAVLSYHGQSETRGLAANSPSTSHLQVVPRSATALSIILPVGSEAGTYDIAVRKPGHRDALARYAGTASIDAEGITTLRANVDFSALKSGNYNVAWRRSGSTSWHDGSFTLR
jgi:hypothetical protein